MSNRLKDYFNYSSSERKGVVVLLIILFLALSGYWWKDLFVSPSSPDLKNLKEDIQALNSQGANQVNESKFVQYFEFNPNEIDQATWERLGFSEKQALSIIKYREKGAYFYKKEDLKKLYVVSDSLYEVLEPYIYIKEKSPVSYGQEKCFYVKLIEDSLPVYDGFSGIEKVVCNKRDNVYSYYSGSFSNEEEAVAEKKNVQEKGFASAEVLSLSCNYGFVINQKKKGTKNEEQSFSKSNSLKSELRNFKVDVNAADTTAFKSLKGIGSYYAGKIVKFRNSLGGFVSVEQLKEVYGLEEAVVEQNLQRLILENKTLKKINVNTCEANELKAHPYISWNIANSIVQIRERHGAYTSLEEIKKSDLVNDEIYRKIAPYLKIE